MQCKRYKQCKPWKTVCKFLKKQKIELPCGPAVPLLSIYLKTFIQKDTCTPMFIAELFIIAKIRKQPKCPSTEEWIKKMWCVCTHACTHNGIIVIKKE